MAAESSELTTEEDEALRTALLRFVTTGYVPEYLRAPAVNWLKSHDPQPTTTERSPQLSLLADLGQ